MESRRNLLASVRGSIPLLRTGRKTALALLVCAAVASVGWLIGRSGESHHVWLFGEQRFSAEQLEAMTEALATAQLTEFAIDGDRIKVPQEEAPRYLAVLAQGRELPYRYFEQVLQQRSWFTSQGDLDRQLELAAQQALAEVIGAFDGVEQAWVSWAATPQQGFGRDQDVRASVAVKTPPGSPLSERTESAIKDLLVGSRAGLSREKVSVINLSHQTADSPAGRFEQDRLRYIEQLEEHYTAKLRKLLAFIDEVIVSVNVELSATEGSQRPVKSDPPATETSEGTGTGKPQTPVPAGDNVTGAETTSGGARDGTIAEVSSHGAASLDSASTSRAGPDGQGANQAVGHAAGADRVRIAVAVGIAESYFRQAGSGNPRGAPDDAQGRRAESIRRLIVAALPSLVEPVAVSIHTYRRSAGEAAVLESGDRLLLGSPPRLYLAAGLLLSSLGIILLVRSAARKARRVGRSRLSQAAPLLSGAGSPRERRVRRDDELSEELQQMVHRNPQQAADILESWIRQGSEQ